MRIDPLAGMRNGIAWRENGAQFSCGRQVVHALPPPAERRKFRVHGPAFFGQAERKCARQQVEVRDREF